VASSSPSGDRAALWTGDRPLVLASTSVTRRDLLLCAGVPVETEAAGIDERAIEETTESRAPADLAVQLAEAKAQAVCRRRPQRLVLGADQVLELDREVLHKPADRAAALRHLTRLSGRRHLLHSAWALARDGRILDRFVDSASLTMRSLSTAEMARYLDAAGEAALSGAGSYQVEGLGIHLFESIAGDHSTILGLPLIPLLARLRGLGCLAI
jgi:septum formation protein